MINKVISLIICFSLICPQGIFAQGVAPQVQPQAFRPLHLRSLGFDAAQESFRLWIDKGDAAVDEAQLQSGAKVLLDYFLIGLSLPNEMFWVNLRPDSPDRVIDPLLGQTDIGRIMLETDVQLKKDTARFTSPATQEGRKYWDRLYKKAEELFGSQKVTIPTLSRPWIVPGEIILGETTSAAYIYKAQLKVMLEGDYLKGPAKYDLKDPRFKELNDYSSGLMREFVLPRLEKEVNTAKVYAPLRQVYYSLILAQWFKARFKSESIDSSDLTGLDSRQRWSPDEYFRTYRQSFQNGEYNISETAQTGSGQVIRSYCAGGEILAIPGGIPAFGMDGGSGQEIVAIPMQKDFAPNNADIVKLEVGGGQVKVEQVVKKRNQRSSQQRKAERALLKRVLSTGYYTPSQLSQMTRIPLKTVSDDVYDVSELAEDPHLVKSRDQRPAEQRKADREVLKQLLDSGPHTRSALAALSGISMEYVAGDTRNVPELAHHENLITRFRGVLPYEKRIAMYKKLLKKAVYDAEGLQEITTFTLATIKKDIASDPALYNHANLIKDYIPLTPGSKGAPVIARDGGTRPAAINPELMARQVNRKKQQITADRARLLRLLNKAPYTTAELAKLTDRSVSQVGHDIDADSRLRDHPNLVKRDEKMEFRRAQELRLLDQGTFSVPQLADKLGVSDTTVRIDINGVPGLRDHPNLIKTKLRSPEQIEADHARMKQLLDEAPRTVPELARLLGLEPAAVRSDMYRHEELYGHPNLIVEEQQRRSPEQLKSDRQKLKSILDQGIHTRAELAELSGIGKDEVYADTVSDPALRDHPNLVFEKIDRTPDQIRADRARIKGYLDQGVCTVRQIVDKSGMQIAQVRYDIEKDKALSGHPNLILGEDRSPEKIAADRATLKRLLDNGCYTQPELAEKSGIPYTTVKSDVWLTPELSGHPNLLVPIKGMMPREKRLALYKKLLSFAPYDAEGLHQKTSLSLKTIKRDIEENPEFARNPNLKKDNGVLADGGLNSGGLPEWMARDRKKIKNILDSGLHSRGQIVKESGIKYVTVAAVILSDPELANHDNLVTRIEGTLTRDKRIAFIGKLLYKAPLSVEELFHLTGIPRNTLKKDIATTPELRDHWNLLKDGGDIRSKVKELLDRGEYTPAGLAAASGLPIGSVTSACSLYKDLREHENLIVQVKGMPSRERRLTMYMRWLKKAPHTVRALHNKTGLPVRTIKRDIEDISVLADHQNLLADGGFRDKEQRNRERNVLKYLLDQGPHSVGELVRLSGIKRNHVVSDLERDPELRNHPNLLKFSDIALRKAKEKLLLDSKVYSISELADELDVNESTVRKDVNDTPELKGHPNLKTMIINERAPEKRAADRAELKRFLEEGPHTVAELSQLTGIPVNIINNDLNHVKGLSNHPNLIKQMSPRSDEQREADRATLKRLLDQGPHTRPELAELSGIDHGFVYSDFDNTPELRNHPNLRSIKQNVRSSEQVRADRARLKELLDEKIMLTVEELAKNTGRTVPQVRDDIYKDPALSGHPYLKVAEARSPEEIAAARARLKSLLDGAPLTRNELAEKSGIPLKTVKSDVMNDPLLSGHPNLISFVLGLPSRDKRLALYRKLLDFAPHSAESIHQKTNLSTNMIEKDILGDTDLSKHHNFISKDGGNPGGIDFRSLPIVKHSIEAIRDDIARVTGGMIHVDLAREASALRRLLKAGIAPSDQRLKEYCLALLRSAGGGQDIASAIDCIADSLRLSENNYSPTDKVIKDLLIVCQSGLGREGL